VNGQKVRVQLYTVPGQVFYDATRKLVLRGADGVVFVADSQNTMRESNLDSLENLKTNLRLNRLNPDKVAIVYQYNKRDLPNVDTVGDMNAYLQPGSAPVVEAVAKEGTGVTATLRAAIARILENLKNNVDTVLREEPELAPPDMSQKLSGAPKLAMRTQGGSWQPLPAGQQPPGFVPPVTMTQQMPAAQEEDPFAEASSTVVHDSAGERREVESMLLSARELVKTLESALQRARDHEKKLTDKLSQL
jgi:hypothetical protein